MAKPAASLQASLKTAINKGDLVSVKRLLKKGADPNVLAKDGKTPLILAVELERTEICAALLAKGADPKGVNSQGWSAFSVAYYYMLTEMNTPNPREARSGGVAPRKMLHMMLQTDAQRHKMPLIGAIEAEDFQAVQHLLASGANPEEHDAHGCTALMWAAYQGDHRLCRLLLDRGARVNRQDDEGHSALMLAASNAILNCHCGSPYLSFTEVDHTEVVEDLLQAGADPNLRDKIGISALADACQLTYSKAICMELIRHGAHTDIAGYNGKTVLECAARALDIELVDTFLAFHPSQTSIDAALTVMRSDLPDWHVQRTLSQEEEVHKKRLEIIQRLSATGQGQKILHD